MGVNMSLKKITGVLNRDRFEGHRPSDERILKSSSWLNEERAIVFIHNELEHRRLRLAGLVTTLLRENRRTSEVRIVVDALTHEERVLRRGNREYYGYLQHVSIGARGKVYYRRSDILRWLDAHVIPRCKPIADKPKRKVA